MTTRTVSVALRAEVSGYIASLGQAAAATKQMGKETRLAAVDHKAAMQGVGIAAAAGGAALVGFAAMAVRANMAFEKSMSGVQAVSNATVGDMGRLRDAAIAAGQATVFSASQSAEAEAELAKAGVSVADILGGALTGSLNLASAGQLALGDAATIAAQAMNIFKLNGSDVSHIADVLAAGANKSAADVGQLGEALRQGGLVAAQTGVSMESTVGALSAFADNALIGSDAGTSLKTMLQRLVPQSKEASDAMNAIGFSAFDSQGKFIGLEAVAASLQKGLGGLSQEQRQSALTTVFGSDAVRAASVLYDQGAAGIANYTRAVNDQGAAQRMAATQLNNLSGDLEQLKGSFETALIKSGSSANGVLREMTQSLTGVVNGYSALPDAAQSGVTAVAGIGGAVSLAAGAFLLAAPRVVATRVALAELAVTAPVATRAMTATAAAVGKAGIALTAIVAIDQAFGGTGSGFDRWAERVQAKAGPSLSAQIKALTVEFDRLSAKANEGINIDAWGLTTLRPTDWTGDTSRAADGADALKEKIDGLKQQQALQRIESEHGAASVRTFGDAMAAAGGDVATTTEALDAYSAALNSTVAIDAYTATANLAKSFKELKGSLKDAGSVTNDEKIALGGFASDVRRTSDAVLSLTGSQEKSSASMGRGRAKFMDLAEAAGYSRKEARRLTDQLLKIPPRTDFVIDGNIDPALRALARLRATIQSSGASLPVSIGVSNKVAQMPVGRAIGGPIRGAGSATSDSIPAYLSNGEYVVRAAAVQKYGTHFFDAANAMRFASGGGAGKPSPADIASARRDASAAASASRVAGQAGTIGAGTPGTDSVADIEAAIAAVQKLTDAYASQQAVVGMTAAQRKKYHAEQRTAAVTDVLNTRRDAAQKRDAAQQEMTDNQASWEFDHLAEDQQVAALDKKIKGEKKFSAEWMQDSRQREQILGSIAQKQQDAADAAAKEAAAAAEAARQAAQAKLDTLTSGLAQAQQDHDQRAAGIASSISGFGGLGGMGSVAAGADEVTGAQVGATDVMSGSLIAASGRQRLEQARTFLANLRALKAAGLNGASLQEILGMGPGAGGAYAAALAGDLSVIADINSTSGQFAALGAQAGSEFGGPINYTLGGGQAQAATFNIFDTNGVLLGTMYGAADAVAGQIANAGYYGRV